MAPRAWPAWSGPFGLAETNSTLTRRPWPKSVAAEVRRAGVNYVAQHVVKPRLGKVEVDESSAGDIDLDHMRRRCGVEVIGELLRQLARVAPRSLGRGQGNVGRPIAVLAPRRFAEVNFLR